MLEGKELGLVQYLNMFQLTLAWTWLESDTESMSERSTSMGRRSRTYNPSTETAQILNAGLAHIRSVPYKVSARWIFYRLLQDGYFSTKEDYAKLINVMGRARHAMWGGWKPDTLVDDTRDPIIRGTGYDNEEEWLEAIEDGLYCRLDKWLDTDTYVEIWFEARAMSRQFEHYTKNITLRAMGGQPSIPYKYRAARHLRYIENKNIRVLYFGDLDDAGDTIAQVARQDVLKWSGRNFEFTWCGLDRDQVDMWEVPENPDKPGEYQWEALSDEGANDIITTALSEYVDLDRINDLIDREDDVENWLKEELKGLLLKWKDR
jgi:hypothetical protein